MHFTPPRVSKWRMAFNFQCMRQVYTHVVFPPRTPWFSTTIDPSCLQWTSNHWYAPKQLFRGSANPKLVILGRIKNSDVARIGYISRHPQNYRASPPLFVTRLCNTKYNMYICIADHKTVNVKQKRQCPYCHLKKGCLEQLQSALNENK